MAYDYSKLQNGSDIRGIAMDTVLGEAVNLNSEAISRLSKGFLYLLSHNNDKSPTDICIAVGRDSRLSGADFSNCIAEALIPYGVRVLDAGLASTPAMFMSTVFEEFRCDGAIMVTASHMPSNRNGMKFFDVNGGLDKGDITDIITFAESNSILSNLLPAEEKVLEHIDLMDVYSKHLRTLIVSGIDAGEKPLSGLSITVDAGNGAGGFYAEKVLAPLGADVSSSQFLEPDGNFPNHIPNPEDKDAIESICAAVKKAKTDLGIIFDTDVDRASAVDENGKEINKNAIVALAAALIAESNPGTTVVTDSVTSQALSDFLEGKLGLKHLRFKRGYRNVINKAISLNENGIDSALAIETSGHAAYKENFFLDDGAYLATKIVIEAAKCKQAGKGISSLINDLAEAVEKTELRLPINGENFSDLADQIIDGLRESISAGEVEECALEEPNYEGVRINFNRADIKGWMLLRKSLHDPIMPLNFESDVASGCKKIAQILVTLLSKYDALDIKKLQSML